MFLLGVNYINMADKEQIKVMFCPKCKSFNVGYIMGLNNWLGLVPRIRCKDCDFKAPIFPILETTKKLLAKSVKDKKKLAKKRRAKK